MLVAFSAPGLFVEQLVPDGTWTAVKSLEENAFDVVSGRMICELWVLILLAPEVCSHEQILS